MKIRNSPANTYTLLEYKNLLETALEEKYQFIGFNEIGIEKKEKICLLRHDIDSELWLCSEMSRIESSLSIKATYFLMTRSIAYNLFCIESMKAVEDLLDRGHAIGLHFMVEMCEKYNREEMVEEINREAEIIAKEFGTRLFAVSFHQPTEKILSEEIDPSPLINTYNMTYLKGYHYISDSNMRISKENISAVFKDRMYTKIQLLIHPMWWTEEPVTIKEKWHRVLRRIQNVVAHHWETREDTLKEISLIDHE